MNLPEIQKDIACWQDAGSWSNRSDLTFSSIYMRLEAIRKAMEERCLLVGNAGYKVFSTPLNPLDFTLNFVEKVNYHLKQIIPRYIRLDLGTGSELEPGIPEIDFSSAMGGNETRKIVTGLRAGEKCSAAFSCISHAENPHRIAEMELSRDGILSFTLEQWDTIGNTLSGISRGNLLTASFTQCWNVDELDSRFPFLGFEHGFGSLGDWIWSVYQIIRRLNTNVAKMLQGYDPAYQAQAVCNDEMSALQRYSWFNYSIDGSPYISGDEDYSFSEDKVRAVWDSVAWNHEDLAEEYTYRSDSVFYYTRDTQTGTAGLTRHDVCAYRSHWYAHFQNKARIALNRTSGSTWKYVPLRVLYQRQFNKTEADYEFYGREESEGAFDTLLNNVTVPPLDDPVAKGLTSQFGSDWNRTGLPEPVREVSPAGDGSANAVLLRHGCSDAMRLLRTTITCDLKNDSGFAFS